MKLQQMIMILKDLLRYGPLKMINCSIERFCLEDSMTVLVYKVTRKYELPGRAVQMPFCGALRILRMKTGEKAIEGNSGGLTVCR
jgi:hypothetical protein